MEGSSQSILESPFDTYGRVRELEFDNAFAEHMASDWRAYEKHQVAEWEILEIHAGDPAYFENDGPHRRALAVMVGPTTVGRMLVIPLEPTSRRGVWRPVTAFEANAHHRERYERSKGNERG